MELVQWMLRTFSAETDKVLNNGGGPERDEVLVMRVGVKNDSLIKTSRVGELSISDDFLSKIGNTDEVLFKEGGAHDAHDAVLSKEGGAHDAPP